MSSYRMKKGNGRKVAAYCGWGQVLCIQVCNILRNKFRLDWKVLSCTNNLTDTVRKIIPAFLVEVACGWCQGCLQ
ncbi:hypothetical protein DPMN_118668 [Dreissena polymorpha]|uniref:Uncharacterized protein n=1 Tax=Dreissena polymorpha TaxID=45954 RepID=A0A9D4GKK3_DREPO|nr:hypothetical protein DPMN_118668 [Dreissena polymorpha]